MGVFINNLIFILTSGRICFCIIECIVVYVLINIRVQLQDNVLLMQLCSAMCY